MVELDFVKVGRTAFVIAQWRAQEMEKPAPLFSDHIANIFLNDETENAANEIAFASPSTRLLVRYRTRYFDDLVREKIDSGIKQIVILGSGLDTRSIRLGLSDVAFYEIEQEHILRYKSSRLERFGYDLNSIMIHCDYTKVDFISELEKKGFNPIEKAFFLWEGNVFYLPYDLIVSVLGNIANRVVSFEIAFDYLSDKLIKKTTGFKKSENLLKGFSSLGAPWNTGFKDIKSLANAVHLGVGEDFMLADYINNHSAEFKVDTRLFDDYSICILHNKC